MSEREHGSERRFRRRADNAMLGGVCAGIADYFGFNLKVTRLLAIIGFLMNPFLGVVAYLVTVMLIPSERMSPAEKAMDPVFKRSVRSSPGRAMSDVRRRFQALDRRLARLEKYVTSSRFQLDQEFKDLGHR